jgi:hypothetical protein
MPTPSFIISLVAIVSASFWDKGKEYFPKVIVIVNAQM